MAVQKTPMSGKPDELRDFAGISASAIVETVKQLQQGQTPRPDLHQGV
jgi:hypothetical protein